MMVIRKTHKAVVQTYQTKRKIPLLFEPIWGLQCTTLQSCYDVRLTLCECIARSILHSMWACFNEVHVCSHCTHLNCIIEYSFTGNALYTIACLVCMFIVLLIQVHFHGIGHNCFALSMYSNFASPASLYWCVSKYLLLLFYCSKNILIRSRNTNGKRFFPNHSKTF